jgi:hypothetical protein
MHEKGKTRMVNAFARLGDRILRGVLPSAEVQACSPELRNCTNIHSLGAGEWYACCTNSCGGRQCTLDYHGTVLGCSYAVC